MYATSSTGPGDVSLFWADDSGSEVAMGSVQSESVTPISSYTGHAWVVRTHSTKEFAFACRAEEGQACCKGYNGAKDGVIDESGVCKITVTGCGKGAADSAPATVEVGADGKIVAAEADGVAKFVSKMGTKRTKYKAKPETSDEIAQCKATLHQADLGCITGGPKVVDFGTFSVFTEVVRSFTVLSELRTSCLIAVDVSDVDELSCTGNQVVPSNQVCSFDLTFSTAEPGRYRRTITYTVNGAHAFKFVVQAVRAPRLNVGKQACGARGCRRAGAPPPTPTHLDAPLVRARWCALAGARPQVRACWCAPRARR